MNIPTAPGFPPPAAPGAIGARLSVMMFLQFFLWGAWYVTMGPYMASLSIDAKLIGWAYTVGPIAAIISPFFLGMIADRFFATERVLAAMHILGGAILCAAPAAAGVSSEAFIGVVFAHMLCYMPTLGLTNTLSFHNMTNPQRQFPMIRVWGTIGWIAANWVISQLKFDTSPNMFYVAGGSGILLGVYSFSLPHTPPPAKGKAFSAKDALGLEALAMLKSRAFAVFMLCSFLICIPLAAYYSFAGEYVGASGFTKIAQTMSFGQISEIGFMLIMPLFFARLGVKWMLIIGMSAWVLRYGLFAGAADEQVKWMVLAGVILHGICYDFFFVTGQIYVDQKSNPAIRGQAQGFLVLVTQGLGLGIGAQVMGRVASANTTEGVRDWGTIWVIPCAFAAVVLVIFFLAFSEKKKPDLTA
ncbi:MAG: nucleoside permease [Phycisphaeraceae bacterium]|nr:nucleoside permease [Phycisphaeraceae bacterium]